MQKPFFKPATLRGLTAVAFSLASLTATSLLQAASAEDRSAAKAHLTQAQDLKKQGKLAEALPHFEEVERLDPKLPTLMDLADCEEQLGKLVEAQAHWAAARDRAKHDEKPQSRAHAEERLAAVEKRVAHLTLQLAAGAPTGTQVFRDDAPVDPALLGTAQVANPGDHVVVVKAAGHEDGKFALKLADGDNQTLPVSVGPSNAPKTAAPSPLPPKVVAPPSQPSASVSTDGSSGQRTVGIIAGAAGIVGLGVGGVLWNVGYRGGNSLGPAADQQLLAGQILVISGGALLVTGAVLFLTAPSGEAAKSARLPITPTLAFGRGATVLGAVGEF